MTKDMICILCPRGCHLTAEARDGAVTVSGNGCPRGVRYAESELLHPVRTVTATVRVSNRPDTMVPVKTETPVPKERMMEVMAALRATAVEAPIELGTALPVTVCGSRIVVTKTVE